MHVCSHLHALHHAQTDRQTHTHTHTHIYTHACTPAQACTFEGYISAVKVMNLQQNLSTSLVSQNAVLTIVRHIPLMAHSMSWMVSPSIMRLLDHGTMKALIQATQSQTLSLFLQHQLLIMVQRQPVMSVTT